MKIILLLVTFGWLCFSPHLSAAIDPVEQLQQQIDELEKMRQQSQDATKPLEKEVRSLASKITNAQVGIKNAKAQAAELAANIQQREGEQAEQTQLLYQVVVKSYQAARTSSPLLLLLAPQQNYHGVIAAANYQLAQSQSQQQIQNLVAQIKQLNDDKAALEITEQKLAALEKQLAKQAEFFKKEIAAAKKYQADLSGQIAALSAQQQAIINERSGSSITSVGEVPTTDDPKASITWKANAPSNSFAVFSFGGYTHRNGMSQYGAKARAQAGQSAEEILKAYYPQAKLKKDYPVMGEINVQGHGKMSFEDTYLQSIYEVPASWPLEVLKAQAIAARTYAIRYTNNGEKSICTSEACQVYKNGKKGGDWEKAVTETRGWVLVDDSDKPVSTQYASTHGGYSNTSGWDTTDKNGSGSWTDRAWEAKASSPWFYKAWYRLGYTASGDACGRDHPWLSQEEMADLLNAWIVRRNPQDAQVERIIPITINKCRVGGNSGNPYSMPELKEKANHSGGAVESISEVITSHTDKGQTAQVKFQTNRGEIVLSGSEFKQIFNLRAPGYLRIPQNSFAHFNVEHKK